MWWTISDYFSLYRSQILLGIGVVAVALVLVLTLRDNVFGSQPPKPIACILLDVSGSTVGARDRYSAQTRSIVAEQSRKDGEVCAIAIKGDPEGQSHVDFWYVGAKNRSNSSSARLERLRQQQKAASAID